MNVAPLFSVLYIVGHYLLLYGRTNNVVKRRAALCFAACQSKKALPAWFASVDADIRIGRRRHPQRSVQTSAAVGADCLYFAAHSKSVCTIRSAERPSQRSGMPQCFHLPSTMRAISSPSSTGSSPTSTLEPTFTVSMCSV